MTAPSTLHVTFRVGTADYAVPASDVLHLEPYERATLVPGAPPYVAGLVQSRGRLVPVVDLRRRFGLPAIEHALERRVVVVQVGDRIAGLLVDHAREVLRVEDGSFQQPPEVLDHETTGYVKAVATVARRLFLLLDVPRVIGEELSDA